MPASTHSRLHKSTHLPIHASRDTNSPCSRSQIRYTFHFEDACNKCYYSVLLRPLILLGRKWARILTDTASVNRCREVLYEIEAL